MNITDCFIDVRALVMLLGGVKETSRKLAEAGADGSPESLYKCMERQSLTSSRLAAIFLIAKAEKKKLSLYDFIQTKPTKEPCPISQN